MADVSSVRPRRRRWPWAALLEESFTNIDLIVILGGLLIVGLIGAIGGAALTH